MGGEGGMFTGQTELSVNSNSKHTNVVVMFGFVLNHAPLFIVGGMLRTSG